MLNYPITVTPDTNGTLLVGFPDLPFANAVGQDREDALANAGDALATALEMLMEEGKPVPVPSHRESTQQAVCLNALATAKILLWNEMQAKQVSKAELATKLGRQLADIELLFDLGRPADIELIEKAASALGKRVDICLA
jgi:antitoxin HicB